MRTPSRMVFPVLLFLATACLSAAAAQDKDSFTPMPLDSGFGPMDLSQPSVPVDQIIKQFSEKEQEFQEALSHYTYRRTASVETIDDDTHKVSGQWYEVDDVIFDPGGGRTEKVVYAPASTLDQGGIMMTPTDLQDIQHNWTFVLTPDNLSQYDVKYVGRQKIDQVECYVFDVVPKVIDKKIRRFEGRIWVDASALQIVVSDGRMVPDDTRRGNADLHPPFITWRQQIDGHYWFPVYTKGEGMLHFAGGYGYMDQDVHIRETVKYADYKRFGTTTTILYNGQDITNNGQPQQPGTQPNTQPQQK
ncbi:MAG TPA: hypothetical protein VMD55_01045 [Terracidiphilus sp.]|nr:hypothetical protein [Terracidiphilus sp.]